jgi:hypothetical protein
MMAKRTAYQNALRNWAEKGSHREICPERSRGVTGMLTPDDDRVRAAANFRLGQFLNETGRGAAAVKYLDEAPGFQVSSLCTFGPLCGHNSLASPLLERFV